MLQKALRSVVASHLRFLDASYSLDVGFDKPKFNLACKNPNAISIRPEGSAVVCGMIGKTFGAMYEVWGLHAAGVIMSKFSFEHRRLISTRTICSFCRAENLSSKKEMVYQGT
jgi:hypothetical protein